MGRFLIILIIIAAILVGGSFYLGSRIGGIVEAEIEKTGSAATQTSVDVGGVNLAGVLAGQGSINGLSIANPSDYSSGSALTVGAISVSIDPLSLLGDGPIKVREVVVNEPAINFEGRGLVSNLLAIKKNVEDFSRAAGGEGSEGRKVVIDNLYVRNGSIAISHAALGDKRLSADLPELHLTGIGENSGGASIGEVTAQIITAVLGSATKIAAQSVASGGILPGTEGGGPLGKLKDIVPGGK